MPFWQEGTSRHMMVALTRPLVLSFALTHVTTLAAYAWRLLGRGQGVKRYLEALGSMFMFGATSAAVLIVTSGSSRYIGLVVTPVLALLHLQYCVRPKYVKAKGKVVFITGCDSGFGHRLALRLDAMGVHVIAACQFKQSQGHYDLVASASSRLDTVQLDVTDEASVRAARQFVEENIEQGEELWCVVNNAGIYAYYGELELVPTEFIEKTMNVNYVGTIRVTKAFLPLLRRSKGRVVNVTSATGVVPLPNLAQYSASKFATEAVSRALRDEMYRWGVQVAVVRPGPYTFPEHAKRPSSGDYTKILWDSLPNEVQDDYGFDYIEAYKDAPIFSSKKEPIKVIDALEDAIMSVKPLPAYNADSVSSLLAVLENLLPSSWRRCPHLISKFTIYTGVTPAALQVNKSVSETADR